MSSRNSPPRSPVSPFPDGPSDSQARHRTSGDHEMIWCSITESSASATEERQRKKTLLVVEDAVIAVHFSTVNEKPALILAPESEFSCRAAPDEGCISAISCVQMLSAKLVPAGALAASACAQHAYLCAEKLCLAIVSSEAVSNNSQRIARQLSDGSDFTQASPVPCIAVPVFAGMLLSTQIAAVLPRERSSLSSTGAFNAAAASVQQAAMWTAVSSKVSPTDAPGVCSLISLDPELRWPSCPLLSTTAVESMQPLLLPLGKGPWLEVSMNGVCVSGCQESSANGFYAILPFFRNGAAVFRKPSTNFHVSSDGKDGWLITKYLSKDSAPSLSITLGRWLLQDYERVSMDVLQDTQVRVVPCSDVSVVPGGYTAVVVCVAPTLLTAPQPGLQALRQAYAFGCRLKDYSNGDDKEVPPGKKNNEDVAASLSHSSETQRTTGLPELPSLQLFVQCQLDIAFPQGLSDSWLRVRCVPRWPKRDVVGELQELSCEIMSCGEMPAAKPIHCIAPHNNRHVAECGQPMLSVTCSNLYFRMGRTPGKEITVSIPRIRGGYQGPSGWHIFLRPNESGVHVDFHYLQGKQLDLYIWPTAVFMHRGWVWPLAGILSDVAHWHSSGVLSELSSLHERASPTEFPSPATKWEGLAWVFPTEEQKKRAPGRPPVRRILQFRDDASVWDVTTSRLGLRTFCVEDLRFIDGWSTIFPLAFELSQGDSRLQIALNTVGDFDGFRSFVEVELQRSISSGDCREDTYGGSLRPASIRYTNRFSVDMALVGNVQSTLSATASMSEEQDSRAPVERKVTAIIRPLQRAATQGWQTLAEFGTRFASPVSHAASNRASDLFQDESFFKEDASNADLTNLEVDIKGLEIWFPTYNEDDETFDRETARELCFLVTMEARGALNASVCVKFPDLDIVHVSAADWRWPEDRIEAEPTALTMPNRYNKVRESFDKAFASITNWANKEDETMSHPPKSPTSLPPSPQGVSQQRWVEARLQALGATAGDKLMVTNGLACIFLWHPKRTVGIRAHNIFFRVPLELLVRWKGLHGHVSSLASCFRRGGTVPETSQMDSQAGFHNSMESQDADKWLEASGRFSPHGGTTVTSSRTPPGDTDCCKRCFKSWRGSRRGRSRFSISTIVGSPPGASKSKMFYSHADSNRGTQSWSLELEVLERIDFKLEGGLLAPSQWVIARVSEMLLQGSVPPKDGAPLCGGFRCEVLCHNEQLGLMEQVVESTEVVTDVQRRGDTLLCSASTTRVNLNMHKVLIDFCKIAHKALLSGRDMPLRPIRIFAVLNLTDVKVTIHWQARRQRHLHGFRNIKLLPGQKEPARLDGIIERSAELNFTDKAGHHEMVTLDLDHTHSRMYLLESSGRHVLVEPNNDVHTGTCVFHIRSPVVIYNETAIPLILSCEETYNIPMSFAVEISEAMRFSVRQPMDMKSLEVPPGSFVNVPLSWFRQGQNALIQPALDNHRLRSFPELSNLLSCGAGDEKAFAGSTGNSAFDVGKSKASAVVRGSPGGDLPKERVNFHTFFGRYLKLMGCVDPCDVPMGGDHDDLPPAQRYEMCFKDVIQFRNLLPVPVILQISVNGMFAQSNMPLECMRNALGVVQGEEVDIETSPTRTGSTSSRQSSRTKIAGRCFEAGAQGYVSWNSELQGIIDLTVEQKVVSYALGVDQEVSLPFAKRAVHIRLLMLPEAESFSGSSYASKGISLFLPANHERIPWPKTITLRRGENEPAYSSDEEWVSRRMVSGVRRRLSSFLGHVKHESQQVGRKKFKALQVRVEVTRNVLTLFAPLVIENLTPLTWHISSEDPTHLLGPMQRRLLPRCQQVKDSAYLALADDEPVTMDKSQEIVHISDLDRLHRMHPVRAPHTCPEACGLFFNSLSFGICVRMAPPPLEFTKIISILPRFIIRSDLNRQVCIQLLEPPIGGKASKGIHAQADLDPGCTFPLHPPINPTVHSGDSGDVIVISDGIRRCPPFSVEPPSNTVTRQRTFHVEMIRENMMDQWRSIHHSDQEEVLQDPPQFIQVAVQQAVLPAKEQTAYTCGGYSVVLSGQNFCGSEDVLFHIENRTVHDLAFFFGGSGHFTSVERERLAGVIRHGLPVALGPASHKWVFRTVSEQKRETRYTIALTLYRSIKSKEALGSISLGTVLTKRPHDVVGRFTLKAKALVTNVTDCGDDSVQIVCSVTPEGYGWTASAELLLTDESKVGDFSVHVADIISAEAEGQDSERIWQVLGDHWRVTNVHGFPPPRFKGHLFDNMKDAVQNKGRAELTFQVRAQIRHIEGPDGVQHFTIYDSKGALAAHGKARSTLKWELKVTVPVLSCSWLHRHREVLAMRIKGIDMHFQRDGTSDCSLDAKVQHLQVDHFEDGDLPVVLNRRLLHVNSRWLKKKALNLHAKWSPTRRIIPEVSVECVPYWLNLELGVLIRLLERYDSGFSRLGDQMGRSEPRTLLPPVLPVPPEDNMRVQVWRLMKVVIEPLRFTIHMRSPERSTFTFNLVARWIMRLPADMPNMDVIVMRVELLDQFGTPKQLLKTLMHKYKDKVKYSAVRSIILSYVATVFKGLLNAVWWLARGPFDALVVAKEVGSRQKGKPWCYESCLWWVSPLIYGLSEGMYRALAEVIGNTVFGLVLFLNMVRHIIFGVTRRRAQGILDGMMFGFQGLLFDSLILPFSQLYFQTMTAHQDWGWSTAAVVFVLCTMRILLGLGPVMGVFHFLSCCCEGIANVLLHEEAQFAPFENQRRINPVIFDPITDDPLDGLQLSNEKATPVREPTSSTLPRKWWLFTRARDVMTDDDEVMEKMMQALQV